MHYPIAAKTTSNMVVKTYVRIQIAAALLLCSCALLANERMANERSANESPQTPAVGEVSLVLGKAWISGPAGESVRVAIGSPVHASDTIETDANGHVHIRFVDNELLSLRPSSTLEIVRYDYNPQNPQDSAVKFNLIEGVSRAISGEAATHARQNFRMNTPIAAIGVRGTDFSVSVSAQSMRAVVNQGTIVVAPYSTLCSAESFGPCSQDAVELSGLSRQILELNATNNGIASALLPAVTPKAQQIAAEAAKTIEVAKTSKSADAEDVYADTVTTRVVNTTLASTSELAKPASQQPLPTPPQQIQSPPLPVPEPPQIPTSPPSVQVPPPIVAALPEFTPPVALAPVTLTTASQLVWGRWQERDVQSERISVSYDVAIENNRQVTVGNLLHALFRVEAGSKLPQRGLGVLGFGLTKAQAHLKTGGQIDLMQVNGGELSVDFTQQRFATQLQLSHSATGAVVFSASGNMNEEGVFNSNTPRQSMAGAVSLDGKEAGYFFEKTLDTGLIEGLTLWNVKP